MGTLSTLMGHGTSVLNSLSSVPELNVSKVFLAILYASTCIILGKSLKKDQFHLCKIWKGLLLMRVPTLQWKRAQILTWSKVQCFASVVLKLVVGDTLEHPRCHIFGSEACQEEAGDYTGTTASRCFTGLCMYVNLCAFKLYFLYDPVIQQISKCISTSRSSFIPWI